MALPHSKIASYTGTYQSFNFGSRFMINIRRTTDAV